MTINRKRNRDAEESKKPMLVTRDFDLVVIDPPTAQPVTLDAVRRQLRIDDTTEDDILLGYIEAASAYWERETETALMEQTLEITSEHFPDGDIGLPKPPFREIVSFTYLDQNGVEQTFDDYEVNDRSRIAILRVNERPQTNGSFNAVKIRYKAGYANESDVPANVKQGLLLLVSHWYEHRLPLERGADISPYAHALDSIIRQASLPRLGW